MSAAWWRPAAMAYVVAAALLLLVGAGSIAAARYPDPDDVLRLVEVRDLIAGQGWFDLTQHRLDAPNGGVGREWSRLGDLPRSRERGQAAERADRWDGGERAEPR